MYGNYTASNNSRDDPECATYPKSGGRTGGSTIFNKRWGHRLNGKCKPIPMTWDDDDDDDEAPQPANGWEEFRNILAKQDSNSPENVEDQYKKSWHDDSHPDSVNEISYEQHHNDPHSGSFYEQRHKYMDNTYPTTRPGIGGGCHPFSAFAVSEKDKIEATPLKPLMHSLAKTEVKQHRDHWIDGILSKTPLPERFQAANSSNLLGDSGISLTTAKSLLTEDDRKSDSKTSSRSLFTPILSRNMHFNAHDLLVSALPSWNKSSEVEEVDSKRSLMDNNHGLSTPSYNKLPLRNQHFQNDETPLKNVPVEKEGIFIIQKLEKLGGNKTHVANVFSEANKENFSYGMSSVSSTTDVAQTNEKEEKKLSRSQSHSSVLRVDNENEITPSKEARSLSTNSSAKSLSNLFHPGTSQGVHASRIPTPIRLHTPHKQPPQISTSATGSQPKMSDVEMPIKFTHSPNEKDSASAIHHPSKPPASIAAKQVEVPLQFGSTPAINSILPSNNVLTTQMNKASAQPSFGMGNGWSMAFSAKSHLNVGSFHDVAAFSGGVSHVNNNQESKFTSDSQQTGHTNFAHQHIKASANDKSSESFVNPNNVDALVSRIKDDHFGVIHTAGSNDSSGPASFAQPPFNPPSSQASNLARKPFSMRPSALQVSPINSDLFHNTQSNPSSISFSSSSQINSTHGQPPFSKTVESNLQTSHGKFSGPFNQAQASVLRVSSCSSTAGSNSNLICSGIVNQQIAQNQFSQSVGQTQISQPGHGLFVTTETGNYSLNPQQGPALALQMNNHPQPLSNSIIPSLANTQTRDSSSSLPVKQDFAVPGAVQIKPQERDATAVAIVRPTSVQSNRKILMVNKKCYEVLRMLGKGASSKVYAALECQTNKCVAVKRVELRQGDAMVEGYLKEVDLLNQLQGSDCIIKLIDSEVRNDKGFKVLYMVMERGEMDLSTSMKLMSISKTPLTPGSKIPTVTVIYYWVSMLNAVDEIHRKGIVHSDLKPANFLLVGGQLKLIDFGIATAVQTDMTSVVKDDPAGTPNYMSPEAIGLCVYGSPNSEDTFKNPKASYKSDVWSLGCILYSLIYGRSPFQHITNERIKLDAIRNPNHHIPFPTNTSVHPPLLRALKRCLVRDYKQRASIAELKTIDYLQSSDLDEEVWDAWKASAGEKILNAVPPECKIQVLKVIQEIFKSPPKRKDS